MHEEKPGGLPPSPRPPSAARAPNYRSPDRVELHYDGLLAIDPALSDAGLVSQLAVRHASTAGYGRRGGRIHRRILQGVVWTVLILAGVIIGSQFYMAQQRVHATDVVQRQPGLLRASAVAAVPRELAIPASESLQATGERRAVFLDETVRLPEKKTPDETVGIVADAARQGSDAGTTATIVPIQAAHIQAESPGLPALQQAPAKRHRGAARSVAGNRPQECSDAVLALQLCGSER